jgi:hypothetical protein
VNLQYDLVLCLCFLFCSIYSLTWLVTYIFHKTLLVHGTILAIYYFIQWTFLLWVISYLVLSRFDLGVVLRFDFIYHSFGMIVLLIAIHIVLFLFCYQKAKKTWEFFWFEGDFFDSFRKILDAHNLPFIEHWKSNNERTKNLFLTDLNESITITFYKGSRNVTFVHKKGIHQHLFNDVYEELKEKSSFTSQSLKIWIIVVFGALTIVFASIAMLIIGLVQ